MVLGLASVTKLRDVYNMINCLSSIEMAGTLEFAKSSKRLDDVGAAGMGKVDFHWSFQK